jgi:segregation and condensation protein B
MTYEEKLEDDASSQADDADTQMPPGAETDIVSRASLLCAILFSAGGTVETDRLAAFFGVDAPKLKSIVDTACDALAKCGLTLIEVAGGWRMVTRPSHFDELKRYFTDVKETGLSKAALETLSIIAYRQPCARTDVEDIRGVASEGVIRGLLEKRLIKVKDRTDGPGRPFRYVTTDRFLELFGLNSLRDLPRVEGVESLRAAKSAKEENTSDAE